MPNKLSNNDLEQLCALTEKIAVQAGEYIVNRDLTELKAEYKKSGSSPASQIVTEVDHFCDRLISSNLPELWSGINLAILSEESADQHLKRPINRLNSPYFWCIDPLDGTLSFTKGEAGYAVSIALISKTGESVLGVVYEPVAQHLYSAIAHQGYRITKLKRNRTKTVVGTQKFTQTPPEAQAKKDDTLYVYCDQSFSSNGEYAFYRQRLENIALQFGANNLIELYGRGAVLNACHLLSHSLACYLKPPTKKSGGGSLWDFGASACIISEAGAWVSDAHGQSLNLNPSISTFMNAKGILYASNAELAHSILNIGRQA